MNASGGEGKVVAGGTGRASTVKAIVGEEEGEKEAEREGRTREEDEGQDDD